ncbi:adhesion G protein-coupled receptor L2-like isoform X2 [Anneissia japonica]|uniref:adhesion G protein-coupled receptor L2-like isoform X2 n=1 Tax=Anneissia japonica TaxID=1529436 RepID=UPI00142558C2|nr:adhesion G protein-coupled receptor L2-like isoform X2 [Anneissia japonica]
MLLNELLLCLLVLLTFLGIQAKGSKIIICENDVGTLECNCMYKIRVLSALYGRMQPGNVYCPHSSIVTVGCSTDVLIAIASTCNGTKTCTIRASNVYDDPCPGTFKYMEVEYECLKPEDTLTIVCPDDVFECADTLLNVAKITWKPAQVVDAMRRKLETTHSISNGSFLSTGEIFINVTTNDSGCYDVASCSFSVFVDEGVVASLNIDDPDHPYSIAFDNISIHLGFNYTGQLTVVAVFWEYPFLLTPQLTENVERNVSYYLNSGLLSIATYHEVDGEINPTSVEYEIHMLKADEMLIESLKLRNINLAVVCGFVDLEMQEWSTSGCYVVYVNDTKVLCKCNHLTSFGILMQVTSYEPNSQHTKALSTLTNIGLILSITLLIITEIVYMINKSLWKSLRNNIHKNLIGNMLAFYVLFLVGIDKVDDTKICKVIAICLHLLLMNIFFWMLGEAVFLVFKVIYTTPSPHNKLRNYMICCYISSIIIIVPAATFAYDLYGNNDYCWLDKDLSWIIVAPALIIIVYDGAYYHGSYYLSSSWNKRASIGKQKARLQTA